MWTRISWRKGVQMPLCYRRYSQIGMSKVKLVHGLFLLQERKERDRLGVVSDTLGRVGKTQPEDEEVGRKQDGNRPD